MNKIKQLIKENPETAFLAGFGLVRDLIGCGAIILTIAVAGYSYSKKVNETKEIIEETAEEVAVTLLQVSDVRGEIEELINKIDGFADKADGTINKAADAVNDIKALSPGGVKKVISSSLGKKLKIVPTPVSVPPGEIPGLAIEGNLQLRQINKWRGRLQLPSVQLSKHLMIESMDRAAELAEKCVLSHAGRNKKYGENLYLGGSSGDGAVEAWASERKNYNARDGSCQVGTVCSHWTAMTWRDTREVGCATASCGDGRVVAVCSFYPPGNVTGQKAY